MKRTACILLLIFIGTQRSEACADDQVDALFRSLVNKSECIASATIVEIGRKVRMEDGVVEYDMRCVVSETFQGKQKAGDTIAVHITEFTMSLGGKYLDGDEGSNLYEIGNRPIFFLESGTAMGLWTDPAYEPVDALLGAMQPSEQLLFYLRMNVQKH